VHRAAYNVIPVVRGEKRPNCRCGKDSTLKNLGLSPDSTTYVCVDHDPRKYRAAYNNTTSDRRI
jgi:hypothetical protein